MKEQTEYLIESYFAGTLTDAEQLALKEVLATDQEAAAEFAFQQKLAGQTKHWKLSDSIQNKQWQEATKPPFRKVTFNRTLLAIAATIALALTAYFFLPDFIGQNGQNAMAGGFEHYPNKMKFKNLGGDPAETATPDVLEAFALYDQKNYQEAATKLTPIFNSNPDRDDYRFYLGVSFSGAHNDHQAINVLMPLAEKTGSSYATPACFYLGKSFIQVKNPKQAKIYLEKYLAAPDGVGFRKQAEALLKQL